ncbi:unnamed protein product [Owenia fusiformis]|uniref:Uncharacterized protein n=1 Tax=Owenia fusiformis TaxID=6347 RepID=A0A8S4P6Q4_OWEFU|nr:unnamed protein product [Owenia fusiformis]
MQNLLIATKALNSTYTKIEEEKKEEKAESPIIMKEFVKPVARRSVTSPPLRPHSPPIKTPPPVAPKPRVMSPPMRSPSPVVFTPPVSPTIIKKVSSPVKRTPPPVSPKPIMSPTLKSKSSLNFTPSPMSPVNWIDPQFNYEIELANLLPPPSPKSRTMCTQTPPDVKSPLTTEEVDAIWRGMLRDDRYTQTTVTTIQTYRSVLNINLEKPPPFTYYVSALLYVPLHKPMKMFVKPVPGSKIKVYRQ